MNTLQFTYLVVLNRLMTHRTSWKYFTGDVGWQCVSVQKADILNRTC